MAVTSTGAMGNFHNSLNPLRDITDSNSGMYSAQVILWGFPTSRSSSGQGWKASVTLVLPNHLSIHSCFYKASKHFHSEPKGMVKMHWHWHNGWSSMKKWNMFCIPDWNPMLITRWLKLTLPMVSVVFFNLVLKVARKGLQNSLKTLNWLRTLPMWVTPKPWSSILLQPHMSS